MSAAALQDVRSAPLALIGSSRAGRRTLLDMLLSAKGYEIATCEDGPAVLEFLKENQPAIAIFDHDLPGMDGREICSRMRFINRLADTPIAIVTPPVEEMGGSAEFESFTDTTTADIVEAEPLGKKKLIERLENVIRDQKGMAYDGKVTMAIPVMAPRSADLDEPGAVDRIREVDVFVDDDVDIEVDVARAIYADDGSFEESPVAEPELAEQEAPAESQPAEAAAEPATEIASMTPEEADVSNWGEPRSETSGEPDQTDEEVEPRTMLDDDMNDAEPTTPVSGLANDMFLDEEAESPTEAAGQADDIDLFADDSAGPEAARGAEGLDWPEARYGDAATSEAPAAESEPELVGVAAETHRVAEAAAEELAEPSTASEHEPLINPVSDEAERSDEPEDDDLSATIEAAIEAVNMVSMEEAEFRASESGNEQAEVEEEAEPWFSSVGETPSEQEVVASAQPDVETAAAEGPDQPDVGVAADIAEKAAELERSEALGRGAKDSAYAAEVSRVESPSTATDGQEEGEAEVLNEERANMQALIAEQAERIENLQERNVLLRQELEQRKADDAMRSEERGNLQALIKEQTEAITNLQQRNVQLRQELEQYKAEESKRESERTFLQAHTSEQAETIAKLQQLNALLRQELEQRKADEAPLREFLQRLLERDEQSNAYQEAMRAEIISLTRENS